MRRSDLERLARLELATEAGDAGRLFPFSRGWVGYWVGEVCKAANVRKVPPHGLRGTHTTIATSAGVTAHVVAAALGHGSADVTREHYIQPGAEDAATARKLGTMMGHDGDEAGKGRPRPSQLAATAHVCDGARRLPYVPVLRDR